MIVPVLMEKIPSERKLNDFKKCSNKELWNIKNILVVYKEELEAWEKLFVKITRDPKESYSALNIFNSGKHSSHSKHEKPHEKSSKRNFLTITRTAV